MRSISSGFHKKYCYASTRSIVRVREISLFSGEDLFSPVLSCMDVLYKCFLEGVGDKEPIFCRQHLRTAQTQRSCVLFTVLQYIFVGFKVNYIIECFRNYVRAEISGLLWKL